MKRTSNNTRVGFVVVNGKKADHSTGCHKMPNGTVIHTLNRNIHETALSKAGAIAAKNSYAVKSIPFDSTPTTGCNGTKLVGNKS